MKNLFRPTQVSAFRLTRHHFGDRRATNLAAASKNVCGIQAQVMSAAELALWARVQDLTRAEIQSALYESRTLVKTSAMRGTLHLLPTADFSIYISALKKSRLRDMRRVMSRSGVTEKEADRVTEAVVEALRSGVMTRRELTGRILSLKLVSKKAQAWFEQGWWGVVRQAMVEGLICYGPDQGQDVTLVHVDQWFMKQEEVAEQEAQRLLLRRYLSAYGPATLRDFSKWTGIPTKEVKPAWKSLEDELVAVSVADQTRWILREDYDHLRNSRLSGHSLRLLPNFDPYMLAHAEKDHLVDARHYKRVYRIAGWISPVVLLDGRVVGIWSYARRGRRVSFEIEPFEKFSRTIRTRIEEEAGSLGDFLEASWEMRFKQ
jgi:uncharacterized protein YcaQ